MDNLGNFVSAEAGALRTNRPDMRIRIAIEIVDTVNPGASPLGICGLGDRNGTMLSGVQYAGIWTHEMGHGLGLSHRPSSPPVPAADMDNVMAPRAGGALNVISSPERDIFRQ